jgi:hypothetical protein
LIEINLQINIKTDNVIKVREIGLVTNIEKSPPVIDNARLRYSSISGPNINPNNTGVVSNFNKFNV